MINHDNKHPLSTGKHSNFEGEIAAVRGFPTSRGLESASRVWESHANASAEKIKIALEYRDAYQKFADDPSLSPELRAEAAQIVRDYNEKTLPHFEAEERHMREGAAQCRDSVQQARDFEVRWTGFDVYNANPAREVSE